MKVWQKGLLGLLTVTIIGAICVSLLIRRGFSTKSEPSSFERTLARAVRNLAIPKIDRHVANPLQVTPETLKEARERFIARCAVCHGVDGRGQTQVGRNLYPRVPDLLSPETQQLRDGEIHYIIANGVQLTGMPGWSTPHQEGEDDSWKFVLLIRDLRPLTSHEQAQQVEASHSAHFVGSKACQKCHEQIYAHWKKTPMANVVRDPREHPDAIIPDLARDPLAKFTKDQVAFVYGSIWKQRYFTRIGDDYFPEPAQWDIVNHAWRPYFVKSGSDWWEPFYPADNMKRPTGPLCDGCHSVDYNIHAKQVADRL
jgi:mono/diheme cytochrome c family protein